MPIVPPQHLLTELRDLNIKAVPLIAICGPGRSGKDVAAKTIAEVIGLPYRQSTSEAATELVWREWGSTFRDALGRQVYGSAEWMFRDRAHHRSTWAHIIWTYNEPDGTRLYRDMIDAGEFILCGIRRLSELRACQAAGIVDLAIYVDRQGFVGSDCGPDDGSRLISVDTTCEIKAHDCDVSVLNWGTEEEFKAKLVRLAKCL